MMVVVQLSISIKPYAIWIVLLLWRKLLVRQTGRDILNIGDFESSGAPDVIDLLANGIRDLDCCCYVYGAERIVSQCAKRALPRGCKILLLIDWLPLL